MASRSSTELRVLTRLVQAARLGRRASSTSSHSTFNVCQCQNHETLASEHTAEGIQRIQTRHPIFWLVMNITCRLLGDVR